MKGLFSLSYLGPVLYYKDLLSCSEIYFENHESWQKQSFRNRCYIDSPNGALMLNIPIEHQGSKQLIKDVRISYHDNWPLKHWQALQTTYNTSPFFEVLGPDLKEILDRRIVKLSDFNLELSQLIFGWLRSSQNFKTTETWEAQFDGGSDYRNAHHPKKVIDYHLKPYPQVFDNKFGFRPNLSIIDLLFNEGPAAYDYLMGTEF